MLVPPQPKPRAATRLPQTTRVLRLEPPAHHAAGATEVALSRPAIRHRHWNFAGVLARYRALGASEGIDRGEGVIQAKSLVGATNDPLEQEADHMAESALRMPEPSSAAAKSASPTLSHSPDPKPAERNSIRRKAEAVQSSAPSTGLAEALQLTRSAGQPLAPASRAFFEPRLGHDFSGVRVHTGRAAERSAKALEARAYMFGEHIVFGAGQYDPGSASGALLLAHELVHVVQQSGGARRLQRKPEATDYDVTVHFPPKSNPDQTELIILTITQLFGVSRGRAKVLIGRFKIRFETFSLSQAESEAGATHVRFKSWLYDQITADIGAGVGKGADQADSDTAGKQSGPPSEAEGKDPKASSAQEGKVRCDDRRRAR
jgi:hypothetical protein